MNNKNTLPILGAGSSTNLGYPTGRQLVEFLVKEHNNLVSEIIKTAQGPDRENVLKLLQNDSSRFVGELKRVKPQSIDAYLSRNPRFKEIGSFLISAVIAAFERNSFLQIKGMPDHSWQKTLFERIFSGHYFPSLDGFKGTNLNLLTFNYDRSFEYLFNDYVRGNFEGANSTEIDKLIQIIHVYGKIATDSDISYYGKIRSVTDIIHAASGLKIMHESRETLDRIYANYSPLIANAERIIFLGFKFDPTNMEKINLPAMLKLGVIPKQIIGTCMELSGREIDEMTRPFREIGQEIQLFDEDCNSLILKYF